MFTSYVKLPEGNECNGQILLWRFFPGFDTAHLFLRVSTYHNDYIVDIKNAEMLRASISCAVTVA